jgi:glycosyltransferase involved in cell wall biosynthesis
MILHSGIGVYLRQLLRHLPEIAPDLHITLMGDPDRIAQAQVPGEVVSFGAPIYFPWPPARWPGVAARAQIIHCPHYNLPPRAPAPPVVTVHDLIHFLGPGELHGLRRWRARQLFASALRRARAVIAISESTRNDLLNVFPQVDRGKVHLITYGLDPVFAAQDQVDADRAWREAHHLPEAHWLTVGIDKPHKNHARLLERMSAYLKTPDAPSWPLIIIGPEPNAFQKRHSVALASLGDRVRVLDPIEPDAMPRLMRGAKALLMPSLREGFGLPAGEAMAAGVPVIAHRVASLPEVLGEAGVLLGPDDDRGWLDAMRRIAVDENWRSDLIAKGRERAKRFRWEATAERTVDVWRGAAK